MLSSICFHRYNRFNSDQILAKSRRKHQKDREESKAHKKFEEYYDRELYGKYTPADISLGDMDAFPSFDESPESVEELPKARD